MSSATSFGTSTTSSDDIRDDVSNQSSKTSNKQSNRTDHASADREHNGNQSVTSQCTKANNSQKDGQTVQKDQPSNTPGKTKANKDSAKSVQVQDVSHKLKKKSTGTKMGSPDTDTKNDASEGQVEVNKTVSIYMCVCVCVIFFHVLHAFVYNVHHLLTGKISAGETGKICSWMFISTN